MHLVSTKTIFDWYDQYLLDAGVGAGAGAGIPERVFFAPEIDSSILIKEGPPPLDWEGYHAAKHGFYDRFQNLKGVQVNMGEAFFNEKYRWIKPEFRTDPNTLKFISDGEARAVAEFIFKDPAGKNWTLKGIFDSQKFTDDIKTIASQKIGDPKTTVWQGRYVRMDGTIDVLQTNVDFAFNSKVYRIAIDAQTGQALNFFEVFKVEAGAKARMQFVETSLLWKGSVTDVEQFTRAGSTVSVKVSATWRGLITDGMKGGAFAGGIFGAFLGAIDGFKQEGIPGALKGLALGVLSGAAGGAIAGGVMAVVARFAPRLATVLEAAAIPLMVLQIVLDSSETALDPQEFGPAKTDADGNQWSFRNIQKIDTGVFSSPKLVPHGIRLITTDGTIMDFGYDESAAASSYDPTPVTLIAYAMFPYQNISWMSVRNPDGSSMWWWHASNNSGNEAMCVFKNYVAMNRALADFRAAGKYPLTQTQN